MNQSLALTLPPQAFVLPPVRLVSRSLPKTRLARLRASWFALGIAFSLGCNTALYNHSTISASPESAAFPGAHTQQASEIRPVPVLTIDDVSKELLLAEAASAAYTEAPATAASIQPEMAAEPIQYPLKLSLTMQSGDTLGAVLNDAGVDTAEALTLVSALRKHYNPRKLAAGQGLELELNKHPQDESKRIVSAVSIPVSITTSFAITRNAENGFDVQKQVAALERKVTHVNSKISGSLYESSINAGMPVALVPALINAFSYDVDFQRDIKEGHRFSVLYEKLETEKGESAGAGNLLYAELTLGNRTHNIYRFVDSSNTADYYNEKGESVRKGLLRTPINGARITSRFGMRRHPILGYSKMHRGVDFGAPTGTPVYAAGDGKVDFVGPKGGYGNYLRLKHNNTYSTAYAHLSRFASGMRHGSKVKQGQIIAYVGSTGASTGPHLHYEVMLNGAQVNPGNVKFKTGNVLSGKELAAFKKSVSQVNAAVAALSKGETKLAQLDQSTTRIVE